MPLKLLRATQSWPGHKVIFLMLSPELSLEVMQAAIAQFGGQLREELGALMERTDILDSCDESINSRDLGSTESFGSKFAICAP